MSLRSFLRNIRNGIRNKLSNRKVNTHIFKIAAQHVFEGDNKKVISLCLYGTSEKYFSNIKYCIESYQHFFPDWTIRIYVGNDLLKATYIELENYGCELITMQSVGVDHRYMFWRFLVLDDSTVSRSIIRDIDSIASERERWMVERWLKSGKTLHVIRDHPSHINLIMGGLWGICTGGIIQDIESKMLRFEKIDRFGIDQDFLESIYRQFLNDIYINDMYTRFDGEQPDVIPHDGTGFFIGEINSIHPHKERHRNELYEFYNKTS